MADLVAQDDLQDFDRAFIATGLELAHQRRRGIESARLQHPRHQRHAHQRVVRGADGHLPQAVVRGKVAVIMAERAQVAAQQFEVMRLLGGDLEPVAVVVARQAAEAIDRVERQVDGVEFDVRQRVNQCRPARGRVNAAALDGERRHQHRS